MQTATPKQQTGYVKFTPNEPQTLTVKDFQYRETIAPWNGDVQHVYKLEGGRIAYLPTHVSERVQNECYAGIPFTIEKRRVNGDYQWIVESSRKPMESSQEIAVPSHEPAEAVEAVPAGTSSTQLEHALKTAVNAAAAAERFGADIGYVCRFTPSDIRAMGISVLIGMTQNQRMVGGAR